MLDSSPRNIATSATLSRWFSRTIYTFPVLALHFCLCKFEKKKNMVLKIKQQYPKILKLGWHSQTLTNPKLCSSLKLPFEHQFTIDLPCIDHQCHEIYQNVEKLRHILYTFYTIFSQQSLYEGSLGARTGWSWGGPPRELGRTWEPKGTEPAVARWLCGHPSGEIRGKSWGKPMGKGKFIRFGGKIMGKSWENRGEKEVHGKIMRPTWENRGIEWDSTTHKSLSTFLLPTHGKITHWSHQRWKMFHHWKVITQNSKEFEQNPMRSQ